MYYRMYSNAKNVFAKITLCPNHVKKLQDRKSKYKKIHGRIYLYCWPLVLGKFFFLVFPIDFRAFLGNECVEQCELHFFRIWTVSLYNGFGAFFLSLHNTTKPIERSSYVKIL